MHKKVVTESGSTGRRRCRTRPEEFVICKVSKAYLVMIIVRKITS